MNKSDWLSCTNPGALVSYLLTGEVCQICSFGDSLEHARHMYLCYRPEECKKNGVNTRKATLLRLAIDYMIGIIDDYDRGYRREMEVKADLLDIDDWPDAYSMHYLKVSLDPIWFSLNNPKVNRGSQKLKADLVRSMFHYGPIQAETAWCQNCRSYGFVCRIGQPSCSACGETMAVASCIDAEIFDLAHQAYMQRDGDCLGQDRLSVLADALEDKGIVGDVLEQLREPGTKYRGLWSLDWVRSLQNNMVGS